MAHIEKRSGRYRARFSDPLGKTTSRTFARKTDAERFLREVDADRVRGQWVDPRDADTPLAVWAEEFLQLCRRLSPTTQETYRRDLERFVLPRFGRYRLGQLPVDEIENWLNDEIAAGIAPSSVHRHYRTLRRMLQVAVQKQKVLNNPRTPDNRGIANLLAAVAPGGTLIVVGHDLEPMRRPIDMSAESQRFDPDAYVRVDDIAHAVSSAPGWEIEVNERRPRPTGAASGHHVDDVVLRVRRS